MKPQGKGGKEEGRERWGERGRKGRRERTKGVEGRANKHRKKENGQSSTFSASRAPVPTLSLPRSSIPLPQSTALESSLLPSPPAPGQVLPHSCAPKQNPVWKQHGPLQGS